MGSCYELVVLKYVGSCLLGFVLLCTEQTVTVKGLILGLSDLLGYCGQKCQLLSLAVCQGEECG